LNTDISQGSAATHLRCGGILNEGFVANLLVNLPVKEFWIGEVMGKITVAWFFDSWCIRCVYLLVRWRSWRCWHKSLVKSGMN